LETDISSGLEQKITQLIRNSILSGEIRQGTHLVEAVFANKYDVSHGTIRTALRDLVKILVDASVTSSVIMFIVVFAGMFSWAASVIGVVDKVANAIIEISPNAVVMIILVNILLLGLGMILDAISISYLVMPILIPVLVAFSYRSFMVRGYLYFSHGHWTGNASGGGQPVYSCQPDRR